MRLDRQTSSGRVFRRLILACMVTLMFALAASSLPSQSAEQSAESLFKSAMEEYRQMEKPGQVPTHARLAEQLFKQLLSQFPDSRYINEAKERMLDAQGVVATYEFQEGKAYYLRENPRRAIPQLERVVENYPNFSRIDEALWLIGRMYEKGGLNFRNKAADAYKRILAQYPKSQYADEARFRLADWGIPVPAPQPKQRDQS